MTGPLTRPAPTFLTKGDLIMNTHTPTPWTVKSRTTPGQFVTETLIVNDQGHVIAVLHCEAEANAQFITRACNCHDDLLEALRDLRDAAHSGGFPHEAIKRADTVLAKIQGGA